MCHEFCVCVVCCAYRFLCTTFLKYNIDICLCENPPTNARKLLNRTQVDSYAITLPNVEFGSTSYRGKKYGEIFSNYLRSIQRGLGTEGGIFFAR